MNRGFVYRARVRPPQDGMTVVAWHALSFPRASAEEWRRRAEAGLLRRRGAALAPDDVVRAGDLLEWHRPPWTEDDVPCELVVLFEDEALLALDKPAGLQVVPGGGFLERTVLQVARASAPDRGEAAPVHRLGRGTSGLQLLGKTAAARAELSRQFREGEVEKLYLALVRGAHAPGSWMATQPIGPVPHEDTTVQAASPSGKASRTRLRVLWRDEGQDVALVAARPITGRPDQIRIHLAASGHPIVGDPLFLAGGGLAAGARPGNTGYLLRSVSLRVTHPLTGLRAKLRAPVPAWSRRS